MKLFKKLVIGLVGLIFTLFLLFWLASYYLIPQQLNQQLQPYQIKLAKHASLSVNPFILQAKIEDLAVLTEQGQEVVATIKYAELDLGWRDLFSQRINIEVLALDSVAVDIKRTEQELVIAGVALPISTGANRDGADDKSFEDKSADSQSSDQTVLAWQLVMNKASIDKLVFNIDDLGHQQQLTFDNISLADVTANLNQQKFKLSIDALINQAPLSLTIDASVNDSGASTQEQQSIFEVKLLTDFSLKQLALADFAYLIKDQAESPITKLDATVDISGQQEINLSGERWQVSQPNFELSVNSADIIAQGYHLNNQALSLTLTDGVYSGALAAQEPHHKQEQKAENEFSVSANLAIAANALKIAPVSQAVSSTASSQEDILLSLQTLSIPDISLSYQGQDLPEIAVEQIELTELVFSQPSILNRTAQAEQEQETKQSLQSEAVFASDKISVNQVTFGQQHLAIAEIGLSAFTSSVVLDKNKQLANLVLTQNGAVAETDAQASAQVQASERVKSTEPIEPSESSQALTFSLGKFVLLEPSNVNFVDQSVSPVFDHQLVFTELQLTDVNSQVPEQAAQFAVVFKLDQYAGANIHGDITPFSEQLNLNTVAKINEFSLPELSSYMRDALGFDFLAGQLDTDLEVNVVNDEIDGEVKIALRGFELSSDNDVSGEHVKESSAIPLNAALNILKDSDGNLHLDIPLSGNVNDPQFGVSSFVTLIAKKAVMAQAENYLINTFVPYANVVTVARVAGKYLLKVKVEDLLYQPGQIDLDQAQQSFVDELAKLLQDREKQRVTMCSVAVATDLSAEQEQLPEPERVKTLQTISEQRGQQLKASLVEQYQIASSRLLLCEPKVDVAEGAKPRVEFSF